MLLSSLNNGTVMLDEGQYGHSGTTATSDHRRGNIAVSPVEIDRGNTGGDLDLCEPQAQRDDGHGCKTGNGAGLGVDTHEEAGRKGQVKHG